MHKRFYFLTIFAGLLLLMLSCSAKDDQLPAVTLGDVKVLEQLADAYRKQSELLPSSPLALTPQARKKFLIRVFNSAGYSYQRSLIALGNSDVNAISKHHRDLAQLIRLPHYGMEDSIKKEIYNEQEIDAINKMEKW